MYEKIDRCPVCDTTEFENKIISEDTSVSNEQFVIVQCKSCDFLFTNPRPSLGHLDKYYDSQTYISHNSNGNTIIKLAYKFARSLAFKSKLKLINRFANENNSLLDYGCGSGHYLAYCKNKGWNVVGVEPSQDARLIANKLTNNVVVSDINEIQSHYQVITLWHVLEHVPNLNKTIVSLKDKLTKNGTLIVAVPNPESWDAKHYKNNWAAYDVPRHLYHFSQSNMKQLMKNHKLKIKEVIPMKMDSFYVSMLSEKNKLGHNNYLQAIINGFKSNSYGKKHNNNFSSLIYVIQK